jgi:hypothetical protein
LPSGLGRGADVRFIVKTSSCVIARFTAVCADTGAVTANTIVSSDANAFIM